jgi:hypothetical protein
MTKDPSLQQTLLNNNVFPDVLGQLKGPLTGEAVSSLANNPENHQNRLLWSSGKTNQYKNSQANVLIVESSSSDWKHH